MSQRRSDTFKQSAVSKTSSRAKPIVPHRSICKSHLPLPVVARAGTAPEEAVSAQPNWLNRTVQGYIGNAGDCAGALIYSVGDSIIKIGNNTGASVTKSTRGWAQGVASYGNDVKDAVGAGGSRVATASNPLSLAGRGIRAGNNTNKTDRSTGSNPLGL